ncbi:MAG: acetyl-CoA carboxylase carboxyl transferase subunit alpha, partial [Parachlamydiaceae bacterium]
GGAHQDPKAAYQNVKRFILEELPVLKNINPDLLIEKRYIKFRRMGAFTQ